MENKRKVPAVVINEDSSPETRKKMTAFWQSHSEPTLEDMMLDDGAASFSDAEQKEISDMLPDPHGKRVLELGAGIGRFTGHLGRTASSVVAVDFMESLIKKNKELHGNLPNIEFKCIDVTKLNFPQNKFDFVFSNWLLMYLSDKEVVQLFCKITSWLNEGGYLFFRESCFYQSGNKPRDRNPTFYRQPNDYNRMIREASMTTGDVILEIITITPVQTYVKVKNNPNQLCWLIRKVKQLDWSAASDPSRDFQLQFLDHHCYSERCIRRYERIHGQDFITNGGLDYTKLFLDDCKLKPGDKVLDIGSGLGGAAFLMAQNYDVAVKGLERNHRLVRRASISAIENGISSVCFDTYRESSLDDEPDDLYDVVLSKDHFFHIKDKTSLLKHVFRTLHSGGRLHFTDLCCSHVAEGRYFQDYADTRGYYLIDMNTYNELLKEAGFHDITLEDITQELIDITKRELRFLEINKAEFVKDFSEPEYCLVYEGLEETTRRCEGRNQTWAKISATKA